LDEGTWQQLKAVTPPLLAYGIAVALGATVFNDRAAALGSSIAVGRPSCPAWTLNPAEQVAAPRPPMAPAPAHGHRRPRPPRPAHRHRPPTAGSSGRSRPAWPHPARLPAPPRPAQGSQQSDGETRTLARRLKRCLVAAALASW